jgi:hypothetical protein
MIEGGWQRGWPPFHQYLDFFSLIYGFALFLLFFFSLEAMSL